MSIGHYDDPFGGPVLDLDPDQDGAQVSCPVRMPGQYDDGYFAWIGEAGPYYNWHRNYAPRLGRYLEPDPRSLGLWLGLTVEPYAFARGAPMFFTDPDGREPITYWNNSAAITHCQCYLKVEIGAGCGKVTSCYTYDTGENKSSFESGVTCASLCKKKADSIPRDKRSPNVTPSGWNRPVMGCIAMPANWKKLP